MIYYRRKEIYSISAEARVNCRVTFKASAAVFRFPVKVVLQLKPKGTLKPALLLPPRTDKALDQLHWWMRCSFPPHHLTLVLSPFLSILPFSFLHSTYYCCGLFFFFLPLTIIICLTLSAEQDFFCYVVLAFTIFFMIFLPVGYTCPPVPKDQWCHRGSTHCTDVRL